MSKDLRCHLCGGELLTLAADLCVECDNRPDLHATWFVNFTQTEGS